MYTEKIDGIEIGRINDLQVNSFEKGNKSFYLSFCSTFSHHDSQTPFNQIFVVAQELKSFSFFVKSIQDLRQQNLYQSIASQKMACMSQIKQVNLGKKCIVLIYHKFNQSQKQMRIRFRSTYLSKIWMLILKKIILDSNYQIQVCNLLKDQKLKDIHSLIPYPIRPKLEFINQQLKKIYINQNRHLGSKQEAKGILNTLQNLYDQPFQLANFILGKLSSFNIALKNQRILIQKNKLNKFESFNNQKQVEQKTKALKFSKQKEQNQMLIRQIQQLRFNLSDKEQNQNRLSQAIIKVQLQNKQQSQLIQSYQRDLQSKKQQITEIKQKNQSLNILLQKQEQKQRQLNEIHTQTIKRNQELIKQIEQQKQLLDKSLKQNQQLVKSLNQKIELIKELLLRNGDLLRLIDKIQDQRVQEKGKLQRSTILAQQYQKLQNQNMLLKEQLLLNAFQGRILHNFPQEKLFMRKEIEKYTKSTISHTNIIYSFDLNNPTNYHKYFDQQQNIAVVIKLKNKRLIGGFSASPVSPVTVATKGGLIFSLTEKKSFKLNQGKRSVTYDNFFLIFGNSELRLKHGQQKFFSNFGIANSFFDSKGQKHQILNGVGSQRQQILEHYEIFKLYFKEEKDEKIQ